MQNKQRESSFELIRIIAQFMIVLYHILLVAIYPQTNINFYKATWTFLHIGVPLFVLISGYFGIKPSIKGLIKLIGTIFILQVPLLFINYFYNGGNWIDLIKINLFVSYTPFWFMRTYLFLYLLSPIINLYLKNITFRHRILLLFILFYISHYIGTLGSDPSLLDGKNVITFLFFYAIGNTLHHYRKYWDKLSYKWLTISYAILNITLIILFTYSSNTIIQGAFYYRICYAYCSPILLLNAIIFFIIIGRLKFYSQWINKIAKSSLSIYLLHGSPIIIYNLISPYAISLNNHLHNGILFIIALVLLTIVILSACIIIDNILTPVWKIINRLGDYLQNKYNSVAKKIDSLRWDN